MPGTNTLCPRRRRRLSQGCLQPTRQLWHDQTISRPTEKIEPRAEAAQTLDEEHRGTSSGLFSGDIVYDDRLLDDTHGGDQKDYVATIARLRDLPVTVVHPGHGSSFDRTRLCEIADACTTARP
ncbi:hypothetical protein GCM10010207_88250 [Streptomyces atratus]|nr:hypothetical protein GCM10010207_88250 [Streptomyces atratus]